MKLKSGFILHKVGGEQVVVPVGARTGEFFGMIRLNESGAFLWEHMDGEFTVASLIKALLAQYDVTEDVAAATVARFIDHLRAANLLESETDI